MIEMFKVEMLSFKNAKNLLDAKPEGKSAAGNATKDSKQNPV